MKKLDFLIVEDHVMARKGIIHALQHYNLAKAIFEAGNGIDAVELCLENPIDLVLMDFSMPKMNGFEASKRILQKKKDMRILVLTQFDEIPIILNFLKIGVKGFLSKMADPEELVGAIRTIQNGDFYYHSKFDDRVNRWLKGGLTKNIPTIHFSNREVQILTLMSKGNTSQQIADKLKIKPRTVETYRYDLIKKTNVKNASELISYVYKNGLI